MSDYRRPEWKHVFLFGFALFMIVALVITIDTVLTENDQKDYCVNVSGTVNYPLCERNSHKLCHGKANLTIFLDCDRF